MKQAGQIIWFPLFFICLLICLVSCEEDSLPDTAASETAEIIGDTVIPDQNYFVWVDQLNVRTEPNLDSDIVVRLKEGAEVIYSNEKSEDEIKVALRGNNYSGPFFKIKTKSGKEGWVFSKALSPEDPMKKTEYVFSGDSLLVWENGISSLIIGDELAHSDLMNFSSVYNLKVLPKTDPTAHEVENKKILFVASNNDISKNFTIQFTENSESVVEKITIENAGIFDQYGVQVGDEYHSVLSKRGKMTQGTNNKGITYAAQADSRIVYELCCPPKNSTKTLYTNEEAGTWTVQKIIWFRDLFKK